MKLYFAYGANLNKQGMQYRCPQAQPLRSHRLLNWRLSFSGVATIQPSQGDWVDGALWMITEQCETNLDVFEGYPTLYTKHNIQLDDQTVMCYVMNVDPPHGPGDHYLSVIAQGYRDWNLDLSALWHAVKTTQQEQNYDVYRSTNSSIEHDGTLDTDVSSMVYDQFGHDLRWLRDDESAYRDIKTI
jgi:gamma-glutamylcyclotransferase (GGCT)/AIG2-like uncharacterized protein YtfP